MKNIINGLIKFFLEGLKKQERACVVAKNEENKLIGCALLKKTENETKICTLFVDEAYRGQGIGRQMMHRSIEFLGKQPALSVSEKNLEMMKPLLQEFGFKLSGYQKGAYQSQNTEFYFNNKVVDAIRFDIIPALLNHCKNR